MKKLLLIALSTSLAMGAHAADNKKFYAGGGLSSWKMTLDGAGEGTLDLTAIEGVAGYEILPWLAVEGRLGFGAERERDDFSKGLENITINEDGSRNFTQNITDLKGELNYYGSLYLKPQIKNDIAIFYGLVGITAYDTSFVANTTAYEGSYMVLEDDVVSVKQQTGASGSQEFDESDATFSMGVGVGFFFKDSYVINIEYKNFIQSSPVGDTDAGLRAHGVTVGVNYSF